MSNRKLINISLLCIGILFFCLLYTIKELRNQIEDLQSEYDKLHNVQQPTNAIFSSNDDEPELFRNVKDVPLIFTVNSFNYTMVESDITECECVEGESEIRKDSEFIQTK